MNKLYNILVFLRNNYVDYQLHFLYAFLLVKVFNFCISIYLSVAIVLFLVIWKELKDSEIDWYDILFGLLGIILAVSI